MMLAVVDKYCFVELKMKSADSIECFLVFGVLLRIFNASIHYMENTVFFYD